MTNIRRILFTSFMGLGLCAFANANPLISTSLAECGGIGGPAGSSTYTASSALVNGASGTATYSSGAGILTCNLSFVVPTGDTLVAISLFTKDDADTPFSGASGIDWTWTTTQSLVTGLTGTTVNQEAAAGSVVSFGPCTNISGTLGCDADANYNLVTPVNAGGTLTGTLVFTVTESAVPAGGGFDGTGVAGNGSGSATLYVDYTYMNNAPEPATMALFGTGLVGLGLLRRRFSKKS